MHIISHFWGVRRDGLCMEPRTAFVRLLVVGRMPVKIEDIYIYCMRRQVQTGPRLITASAK